MNEKYAQAEDLVYQCIDAVNACVSENDLQGAHTCVVELIDSLINLNGGLKL